VGSETPSAPKVAHHELPQWMRTMVESGRVDEMIAAMTALVDEMAESHARVLLSLKQSLKHRYGRRSEKMISDEQLRLVYEGVLAEKAQEQAEASPHQQSVDAFSRSAEALIRHDSADRLGAISAPTMVSRSWRGRGQGIPSRS